MMKQVKNRSPVDFFSLGIDPPNFLITIKGCWVVANAAATLLPARRGPVLATGRPRGVPTRKEVVL